jgi:hypothetical protein
MTAVANVPNRTEEELAVIRMSLLNQQPPTTITASVVDEHATFDDALRGARNTLSRATRFSGYELPDALLIGFAPVGEDWAAPLTPQDAQDLILQAGERTRRAYNLPVGVLGQFTGGSGRRYQDYRLGAPMPIDKQAQLAEAVAVVDELGAIDPYATEALFSSDPDAVALLVARNYEALVARFEVLRDRLARSISAAATNLAGRLVRSEAGSLLTLASSPEFAKVVEVLDFLLPETHATRELWRISAKLELAEALRRYEEESAVTEKWSFLADLDEDRWSAFERDADRMLANPHMTETEWLGWLRDVGEAGRASRRHFEPLPPAVLPPTGVEAAITVTQAAAQGRLSSRHPFPERGRAEEA